MLSDQQYCLPCNLYSNHYLHTYVPAVYSKEDRLRLRALASDLMEAASLPVQEQSKAGWRRLNDLQEQRPLVWHNEICWNEMNVNDELTLQCETEFARKIESDLRKGLYLWKHMGGDMVIEPFLRAPKLIDNSGIGVDIVAEELATDQDNEVKSQHFIEQIRDEEDVARIVVPQIRYLEKETIQTRQAYEEIFHGLAPIRTVGVEGLWFAPWDDIVRLCGVQDTMEALLVEPEFMHKLIDRIVTVYLGALDSFERQGLLSTNNANVRVGSGAYGYTSDLPADSGACGPMAQWGCATPQIFGQVSPGVHEEFGIAYEKRWLERFGLSYYGCCEQVHDRIDLLRTIKNLRKISISPWSDKRVAAEQIGRDFVVSLKPSPAILAAQSWDLDGARAELRGDLVQLKGCNVEVVMKDISTVRYEPQRLWEWVRMAMEEVQSL